MGATMVGMATSADKPGGVLPPIAGISDNQYRAIGRIAVQFGFLEVVLSDLCPLFRSPTGGGPSPGEEMARMLDGFRRRINAVVADDLLRQRWRRFVTEAKAVNKRRTDVIHSAWAVGDPDGVWQLRAASLLVPKSGSVD